jgi:2-C-methyl-D-erythritol 2,4-cyclodiphosphate synthase
MGYDSHRLVEGESLIVGGVRIPFERGLEGHSDADVLAHAVIDALLGAAGSGDIGERFPDSDSSYAGADSIGLLELVVAELTTAGFTVVNVDCTVVLERPKLAAHRAAIRERLAHALGLPLARVNVKATSGEGIGFVGREEGAAALAIATLRGG